jgi:hypothetical protein
MRCLAVCPAWALWQAAGRRALNNAARPADIMPQPTASRLIPDELKYHPGSAKWACTRARGPGTGGAQIPYPSVDQAVSTNNAVIADVHPKRGDV